MHHDQANNANPDGKTGSSPRWRTMVVTGTAVVALGAMGAVALHFKTDRDRMGRELLWQKAIAARQNGELHNFLAAFDSLAQASPGDPRPAYEAACDADALGNYNLAREGYLSVLQRLPTHADARLKLVLLTARAGVAAEAAHHLEQLQAIVAPSDPRLAAARAAIARGRQ